MKVKCFNNVKVRISTDSEELVEKLCDRLADEFPSADWEWSISNVNNHKYEINGTEYAEGDYYAGKAYTSNGDGYPDEWDVEFETCEQELNKVISEFTVEVEEEHAFLWNFDIYFEPYDDCDDYDDYCGGRTIIGGRL